IGHHLDPLSDTLTLAREAEHAAKEVPGKNALAIMVSKRSGSTRAIAGKWGELDKRIEDFLGLHCNDEIPDGAGYELRDLALRLNVEKTDPDFKTLEQAQAFEAQRILLRKRAGGDSKTLSEDLVKKLSKFIVTDKVSVAQLADE